MGEYRRSTPSNPASFALIAACLNSAINLVGSSISVGWKTNRRKMRRDSKSGKRGNGQSRSQALPGGSETCLHARRAQKERIRAGNRPLDKEPITQARRLASPAVICSGASGWLARPTGTKNKEGPEKREIMGRTMPNLQESQPRIYSES